MMWSRILAVLIVRRRHAVDRLRRVRPHRGSGRGGRAPPRQPARSRSSASPSSTPRRESHARAIVLSGRTEADDRASAVARTAGSIVELKVRRGDGVSEGDVIAVLSDEAREAQVAEAEALVAQRQHHARGAACR